MVSLAESVESPLTARKPGKKGLYAEAFRLFVEGESLPEIAGKTGIPVERLADTSIAQNWAKRRANVAGAKECEIIEHRIHTQARVDVTLCRATEEIADQLASSYVSTIKKICELSVEAEQEHPDIVLGKQEARRQHVHRLRERIELQKLATEGLREMIATAQQVGLLRVDSRGRGGATSQDDAPIDLSKLTQLRILVEATAGPAEKRAETAIDATVSATSTQSAA